MRVRATTSLQTCSENSLDDNGFKAENREKTIRKSDYRTLDYSQKWGLTLDAKIYYFAKKYGELNINFNYENFYQTLLFGIICDYDRRSAVLCTE